MKSAQQILILGLDFDHAEGVPGHPVHSLMVLQFLVYEPSSLQLAPGRINVDS